MSNKMYDVLKWVVMIVLPALATFVITICGLWSLPYSEPISGTITAVAALLGAALQFSNSNYSGDGTLNIDTSDDEVDTYSLDLTTALADLPSKSKIVLTVNTEVSEEETDELTDDDSDI